MHYFLSTKVSADYQFVHMPMPSTMNKQRISNQHSIIPIDRIVSTSVENHNKNILTKKKNNNNNNNNNKNKNGLKQYLNINITSSPSSSSITSRTDFKKSFKKNHVGLNTFLAHNAKYQNLHIILILLLLFCVFLIISLCSPDMIGIDNSFQNAYYPISHNDNFIFVYGELINKNSKLRDKIKYTPKSQRKNPYILHDHFDPEGDINILNDNDNNKNKNKNNGKKQDDDYLNDDEDDDELMQEFAVRIHHLRRGFYFDTSFNNMDNEQIIKAKDLDDDNDINMVNIKHINHSYTALGVQFDEEYDRTVNGLLLRIDENALQQFDLNGAGKAFRREEIPLQWIDFLYNKPKEFTKNIQLEKEKLNAIKKEQAINDDDDDNNNHNDTLLKIDIDDANSMVQHVDIEVDDNNDNDDINLIDLVDIDQGVILEDNKNINKDDTTNNNNLEIMNESNRKKYQLNVWTYIVPNEIIITNNNGQFERIMKQSYIDIILSGCLDIGGQQFAKEFIQSTFGWTPFMFWNDDRGQSKQFKYEEQFITNYEHEKIDLLLNKYVFGNSKK